MNVRFFSTYGRAHPEKGKKFLLGKIEYVCSIMYMSLGVVGGGLIIGLIAFLLEAGLCWVQLSIWGIQVWEEGVDIATIVSHCIY